eukprot:jgi/Mesvir1/14019/Mv11907-RA.1
MEGEAREAEAPEPWEKAEIPHTTNRLALYDMGKQTGKGGYSVVHKAIRKSDGLIVAMKIVEIFDMPTKKRERCLQEVQLLISLKHPHIISMLDAFIEENQLYIVFEWALLGDMKRLIRRASDEKMLLDETVVWGYFLQISDALHYMHGRRVMHRDIKPANVLLTEAGVMKLADLGLGRYFSPQTNEAFSKVGTPYYVSPEVVKGSGYDWKSDIWSLGCMLYELLTLRSPFEITGEYSLYAVFQKISSGSYVPLDQHAYSRPCRELLHRMLQTDPDCRPDTGEVFSIAKEAITKQVRIAQDPFLVMDGCHDRLTVLFHHVACQVARQEQGQAHEPADPKTRSGKFARCPSFARHLHACSFATATMDPTHQFQEFSLLVAWLLALNGYRELPSEAEMEGISLETLEQRQQLCTEMLAGLDKVGVPTEFVPRDKLLSAHGQVACYILDCLTEKTLQGLGVLPRPSEPPLDELVPTTDASSGIPDAEAALALGSTAVGDIAAGAQVGSWQEGLLSVPTGMNGSMTGQGEGEVANTEDGLVAGFIWPHVDASLWDEEMARVAPKLDEAARAVARGVTSASGTGWYERVKRLGLLCAALQQAWPQVCRDTEGLQQGFKKDLEAVDARERLVRGNSHLGELEGSYRELRAKLDELINKRKEAEDSISLQHELLEDCCSRIAAVTNELEATGRTLDGDDAIKRIKSALSALKREVMQMDVGIGVRQQQLLQLAQSPIAKVPKQISAHVTGRTV